MRNICKYCCIIAVLLLCSCKMKLTTHIPNLICGKWEHLVGNESSRTVEIDKNGKFRLTEHIIGRVTEGKYTISYSSFHITDASGEINVETADGSSIYYQFIWEATAAEGPKSLALTESGLNYVYTYFGDAVITDGDDDNPDAPAGDDSGSSDNSDDDQPSGDESGGAD